jgi:hypothetical protein
MWDKISSKIKLIFGAIVGIFSFIFLLGFGKKITSKKILENELDKIKKELELEYLNTKQNDNIERIEELERKKEEIKRKIEEIGEEETGGDTTKEELDDFFDSRGF